MTEPYPSPSESQRRRREGYIPPAGAQDLPSERITPAPGSQTSRIRRLPPPLPGRQPTDADYRQSETAAYQQAFDSAVSIAVGQIHALYERAFSALLNSTSQTPPSELANLPPRAQVLLVDIIRNSAALAPQPQFTRQEEYTAFVHSIPSMTEDEVSSGLQRINRQMLEELLHYFVRTNRDQMAEVTRTTAEEISELREGYETEIQRLIEHHEEKERDVACKATERYTLEKSELLSATEREKRELIDFYDVRIAADKLKASQIASAEKQALVTKYDAEIHALKNQLGEAVQIRELLGIKTLRINELQLRLGQQDAESIALEARIKEEAKKSNLAEKTI